MTRNAKSREDAATPRPGTVAVGAVLLVAAAVSSLMLAAPHLLGASLPGCGPDSPCARAAASVWGSVPGLGWPTSHVGLAFFAAVLVAWIVRRGSLGSWLRWIVRLGGLVSVVLVVAMIVGGYVCAYCLAVHVANLAFVALALAARGAPAGEDAVGPLLPFGGAFLGAMALLVVLQVRHDAAVARADEEALSRSTRQIIAAPAERFTGRYRIGPETAPIRIVIISDYQCPDCKRIEQEVRTVLAGRDDVSFSAKHFPFCRDCNRVARDRNYSPHPNACWAARAAETAGLLAGEAGFWRMHHWLFDRGGSFTDAEIKAALPELGFDTAAFLATMQGPEPLRLVHEDIEEAIGLGIRYTPMIFVNGVQLRGWQVPDALVRAVAEIAATNPEPGTAAEDQPPAALEKHVGDWREQPVRRMPRDAHDWGRGPADAGARIVVWGDYREPNTAEIDARITAALGAGSPGRYAFRHYPIDQSCNPQATRTLHPLACRAAMAAEAAGRLGGVDAYWRMHTWLFGHQQSPLDDASLRAAATEIGLDPAALLAGMQAPVVAEAIRADAATAKRMGLRSIPFIFVNGRWVQFWRLENEPVIERIIAEASAKGAGGGP